MASIRATPADWRSSSRVRPCNRLGCSSCSFRAWRPPRKDAVVLVRPTSSAADAMLLLAEHCTDQCPQPAGPSPVVRQADIVVAAVGRPQMVGAIG